MRLCDQDNLSTKKEYEDLVGKQFEKLKVIKRLENSSDRRRVYLCQCECGNFTKVKARYLNCGDTRSCGCYIQTPSCGCYAKEMSSKRMSEDILVKFKNNRNKNWYFIKNDEIVYCRSGYEVIYANYLILNNIEFEYEPECFKLDNGIKCIIRGLFR